MKLESAPQGVIAGSIPLFAGHPARDLLPIAGLRPVMSAAWDGSDAARLLNYGDEQGNRQLIDYLTARLQRRENLDIGRDNLMIIGGSTGGVGMLTQHLTAPGDLVLVDAPSYRDALHIFRDHQLEMRAAPIDDEGIVIGELERILQQLAAAGRGPRFYYVVPNFQNPTGITMSRERRLAVIELSRAYDFAIIEDDVYSDIRFGGAPPASFFALAGGHNVFRLGSFSKTLAPGLRVGWLIAERERIAGFVGSGLLRMGGGANPFSAAVVADYCGGGAWEAHVQWLRGQYQMRRDIALAALQASMPAEVTWTRPNGGYFIWLRLPPSVHVDALERPALAENVYFASGKGFYVNPEQGAHCLRLSFSYVPLADLKVGIEVLADIVTRMMK